MEDNSNGESTFEIIDKKIDECSVGDKTESMSSMSSSITSLPSRGVSSGNLLSNVPPPAALPSFVASSYQPPSPITQPIPSVPNVTPATDKGALPVAIPLETALINNEPFHPTQFSAAIPPSKGVIPQCTMPLPQPMPQDSSSFLGWLKGVTPSGGILLKVAEKAKQSVDSMITTLDPQMREYIYSGGDIDVIVATESELKVSAVREAFQAVFGKATVSGIQAQSSNIAPQPVGFAAGVKACEERIQTILQSQKMLHYPVPVVAIENFILEVGEDKWFDLGVLILSDPQKKINLQTFTQMTPVPTAIVNLAQEATPTDFPLRWSGLNVTVGRLMAENLHVHHSEWHQALTGVSRRDTILMAAKTLATLYKNIIVEN